MIDAYEGLKSSEFPVWSKAAAGCFCHSCVTVKLFVSQLRTSTYEKADFKPRWFPSWPQGHILSQKHDPCLLSKVMPPGTCY